MKCFGVEWVTAGGLKQRSSCLYHDLHPLSALWIIEWSDICHPIKKRLLFLDKPESGAIQHFVTHDWNMKSLTSGIENVCVHYLFLKWFQKKSDISYVCADQGKPGKFTDSWILAKLSGIDSCLLKLLPWWTKHNCNWILINSDNLWILCSKTVGERKRIMCVCVCVCVCVCGKTRKTLLGLRSYSEQM